MGDPEGDIRTIVRTTALEGVSSSSPPDEMESRPSPTTPPQPPFRTVRKTFFQLPKLHASPLVPKLKEGGPVKLCPQMASAGPPSEGTEGATKLCRKRAGRQGSISQLPSNCPPTPDIGPPWCPLGWLNGGTGTHLPPRRSQSSRPRGRIPRRLGVPSSCSLKADKHKHNK